MTQKKNGKYTDSMQTFVWITEILRRQTFLADLETFFAGGGGILDQKVQIFLHLLKEVLFCVKNDSKRHTPFKFQPLIRIVRMISVQI